VWVADVLKHHQALSLFCDGAMKNVLLHQGDAVGVERDQFHHEAGSALESSAMEGFVH